ncbi:hypothetical protein NEOLEDRAFT_1183057 [Neolentinus lepideus HHB14362 ss-1]|uniref:Uncharacterized protein n=1 Tax=Neolentinus lepideus HHB14362 ss-1 TaxID=1314782 RepID=A0A165NLM6_9AGAM|nr:hypothetical protein NEOLEDRAFT_1183057 [Neolentinus lepideus HHB14362 ss-1]
MIYFPFFFLFTSSPLISSPRPSGTVQIAMTGFYELQDDDEACAIQIRPPLLRRRFPTPPLPSTTSVPSPSALSDHLDPSRPPSPPSTPSGTSEKSKLRTRPVLDLISGIGAHTIRKFNADETARIR